MKTNFSLRKAKYGLPLVLLPFIVLGAYVISISFPPDDDKSVAEKTTVEGLNSNLPNPALSAQKDKFTLLQELLQQRRKKSGLEELEEELAGLPSEQAEEHPVRDLESLINPVADSLKVDESQIKTDSEMALRELQRKYFPDDEDVFTQPVQNQPQSHQADELAIIRQQLACMDSVMKMQAQNRTVQMNDTVKVETKEIFEAKKADRIKSDAFHTLTGDRKQSFITAILDEAQTVVDGSRIRIRLLDDIFIGDLLFSKGSCLYGLVSGFSAQRVHVSVTSVLYGDCILKTQLSIYDNDGIKGLYVPDSDFRDMMRQAGSQIASSSNINVNSNQNVMQQMMSQAGNDFYRSVTRAVSARIRQNKAKLKYASQIYLINEKTEQL
ncbi:MAG: conjugative transposon protein TraM [Tannerella sp.]|jgi:conjugative transposon TraM protein|nr:conjugative transposon protein TraM [Tannerella sp.]